MFSSSLQTVCFYYENKIARVFYFLFPRPILLLVFFFFSKGGVETRDTKCRGGGVCPLQARYEKQGGAVRFRPDTKSGGGLLSRRGGGTLYERGGCNPQTPPPPPPPPTPCIRLWEAIPIALESPGTEGHLQVLLT